MVVVVVSSSGSSPVVTVADVATDSSRSPYGIVVFVAIVAVGTGIVRNAVTGVDVGTDR